MLALIPNDEIIRGGLTEGFSGFSFYVSSHLQYPA